MRNLSLILLTLCVFQSWTARAEDPSSLAFNPMKLQCRIGTAPNLGGRLSVQNFGAHRDTLTLTVRYQPNASGPALSSDLSVFIPLDTGYTADSHRTVCYVGNFIGSKGELTCCLDRKDQNW